MRSFEWWADSSARLTSQGGSGLPASRLGSGSGPRCQPTSARDAIRWSPTGHPVHVPLSRPPTPVIARQALPCQAKVRPSASCAVPRTVLRSATEHGQRAIAYGLRPGQRRSPGTRSRSLRRRRPQYCPDPFNKAMVGSIVSRSLWPIGESTWMRFISSKSSMPSIATTAPRAWLSVKIEESSSTPLKLRLQLQSISSPL